MKITPSVCFILPALLLSPMAMADTKPPKPVSSFMQCDGRTGHVGLGETLGRLLAITATAGLSEAATAQDDASRRLDGDAGAAACATAITQEGDPLRRVELGMAQTIHLMEAGKLPEAMVVAQRLDALAGPMAQEWGYRHTLQPRTWVLQAEILLWQKDLAGAEALIIRALQAAPYDVALIQAGTRPLLFGGAWTPTKATVIAQVTRLMPGKGGIVLENLLSAGRLDDAAAYLAAINDANAPFYTDFNAAPGDTYRALVLVLMGKTAESAALAAKVEASIAKLSHGSLSVANPALAAQLSEMLGLRTILAEAAAGNAREARATFRAHGPWLLVGHQLLVRAVDTLRTGATPAELTGTLADSSDVLRQRRKDQLLAAFIQPEELPRLYRLAGQYAKREQYLSASNATWKVGAKPKFLARPGDKQLPTTDVLDTLPSVNGLPAGEAVMLQAALIAQSRGANAFVLKDARQTIWVIAMRTGNAGDPGMPALMAFDAATVVADLSASIPKPVPRN